MQKLFTQKYYSDKRQNASTKSKALVALVWVSIFWGTTWLASKEGVRNMPALQMVAIRQLMAGIIIHRLFFLLKKRHYPKENNG